MVSRTGKIHSFEDFIKMYPFPHFHTLCTGTEYCILRWDDRYGGMSVVDGKAYKIINPPKFGGLLKAGNIKCQHLARRNKGSNMDAVTGQIHVGTFVPRVELQLGRIDHIPSAVNKPICRKQKERKQMYYVEIEGRMEGFKTLKLHDMMLKIRNAARQHKKVRVRYKKIRGGLVKRVICPFAYEDGYLYLTDDKSGQSKVKSYLFENIKSAVVLNIKFRSEYEVEL